MKLHFIFIVTLYVWATSLAKADPPQSSFSLTSVRVTKQIEVDSPPKNWSKTITNALNKMDLVKEAYLVGTEEIKATRKPKKKAKKTRKSYLAYYFVSLDMGRAPQFLATFKVTSTVCNKVAPTKKRRRVVRKSKRPTRSRKAPRRRVGCRPSVSIALHGPIEVYNYHNDWNRNPQLSSDSLGISVRVSQIRSKLKVTAGFSMKNQAFLDWVGQSKGSFGVREATRYSMILLGAESFLAQFIDNLKS